MGWVFSPEASVSFSNVGTTLCWIYSWFYYYVKFTVHWNYGYAGAESLNKNLRLNIVQKKIGMKYELINDKIVNQLYDNLVCSIINIHFSNISLKVSYIICKCKTDFYWKMWIETDWSFILAYQPFSGYSKPEKYFQIARIF